MKNAHWLVRPLSPLAFIEGWFERRAFFHSGAADPEWIADPRWDDLPRLLAASPSPPVVWSEVDGSFHAEVMAPAAALARYEDGATLYFGVDAPVPRAAAEDLAVAARRRPSSIELSLFAARSGGTRAHFDVNENFTVQLRGNKQWRLAPNAHVRLPTENYVTGMPVPEELAVYAAQPLPERMPDGAESLLMTPGSILYLPRGMWHQTSCDAPSLSLNINFSLGAGTWVDLLTPLLERLAHSPSALDSLAAAAILGRHRGPRPARVRRNRAAFVERIDATTFEIGVPNRADRHRLTVPPSLVAPLLDIASQHGEVTADPELLDALFAAGLLVPFDGRPAVSPAAATTVSSLRRRLLRHEPFRAYGAVEWDEGTDVASATIDAMLAAIRMEET